ncbi:MAG: RpiB/LacA/LacB family sugar-phosphate isomerase [Spirochaetes bacterium]|nr:RpiB/LacA/LacB family sugar-phosphate isomerase [Spirochaetota bacterium]
MNIAVVNEISAVAQNPAIVAALEGRGHRIINAAMKSADQKPELTYINTGFLAALLLNAGRADLVVGGCGTGEGFLISASQYPGVFCGLIASGPDAWLFGQINGGNCISLPLLYGYGWAGDVNLRFIFDRLFSVEFGAGYPAHRSESQKKSRALLAAVSKTAHRPFPEIVAGIDEAVIRPVLEFPGVMETIGLDTLADAALRDAISSRLK